MLQPAGSLKSRPVRTGLPWREKETRREDLQCSTRAGGTGGRWRSRGDGGPLKIDFQRPAVAGPATGSANRTRHKLRHAELINEIQNESGSLAAIPHCWCRCRGTTAQPCPGPWPAMLSMGPGAPWPAREPGLRAVGLGASRLSEVLGILAWNRPLAYSNRALEPARGRGLGGFPAI